MASLPRVHPCAVVDWSAVYYSQLHPAYFDDQLPPSLSEPQICTHFSSIRQCLIKALHPQQLCRVPFYDGHGNRRCGQLPNLDAQIQLRGRYKGQEQRIPVQIQLFSEQTVWLCDNRGRRTVIFQLRASKKALMIRPTTLTATPILPFGSGQAL